MSPYSFLVKKRTRGLRARGFSFREIGLRLGIAKSSASLWTRNVRLDKEARLRLKRVSDKGTRKGRRNYLANLRAKESQMRQLVDEEFKSISTFDQNTLKVFLALLFWCEGSKRLSDLRFTNSDPAMIAIFLKFFRSTFILNEKLFRCSLHLHSYHNEQKQLDYWSKITHIPKSQFIKVYQKPRGGKRIHEGYQGCLSVYYYDTSKAKELYYLYQEIIGAYFNGRMRVSKT